VRCLPPVRALDAELALDRAASDRGTLAVELGPDLVGSVDAEVLVPYLIDLRLQLLDAQRPRRKGPGSRRGRQAGALTADHKGFGGSPISIRAVFVDSGRSPGAASDSASPCSDSLPSEFGRYLIALDGAYGEAGSVGYLLA
jgi:hypothetical protein